MFALYRKLPIWQRGAAQLNAAVGVVQRAWKNGYYRQMGCPVHWHPSSTAEIASIYLWKLE